MTNEKNPYESQNTLDIPNFSEKEKAVRQEVRQDVTPVVKEIRKEVRREVKTETPNELEPKKAPKKAKSFKINETVLLALAAAVVVLLLLSLFSVIYAINQKNALNAKEQELTALQESCAAKEARYESQIKSLQDEIDNLKAAVVEPVVNEEKQQQYEIVVESLNVRSSASTDADIVDSYTEGAKVLVYGDLVKDSSGKQWGKVGDGKWICVIDEDGSAYAKVVE